MARTPKEGLDYFPVVTKFEDKTELLIAEFGPSALGIVISLYQKIYANSCYINWDNDMLMLFARYLNTETTTINTVITRCFDRKILNKKLFDKYKILTSHGIQKQYLRVCKESRRKKVEMIKEYCLIKDCDLLNIITDFISINAEEIPINVAIIAINDSESTQSKVKESKEKKSTINKPENPAADIFKFYQTNFPGTISSIHYDKINNWIDDTEEPLVLLAFEKAIMAEKRSLSYVEGILNRWIGKGIKTRKDAEIADKEFQRKKEKAKDPPVAGPPLYRDDFEITEEEQQANFEKFKELTKSIGKGLG